MRDPVLPADRCSRCRRSGAEGGARRLLVVCAAVVAVCLTASRGAGAAPGYVEASGSQFTLNGRPWTPIGYNQYRLTSMPGGYACGGAISDASLNLRLDQMQAAGANVVRTWFFQSYYDAGGWAPFDRVLDAAAARGMKVIPVLVNQWGPDDCEPPSIHKNHSFYQSAFRSPGFGYPMPYKEYASKVAEHYKDDKAIAFWQLVNEAEAPYSHDPDDCGDEIDSANALRSFALEMRSHLRSVDSNHLLSLGTIGDGQCGTSDGNYKFVHEVVDVCEIHDYAFANEALPKYPRDPYNNVRRRIQQCGELGKPIFVGESGIVADVGPSGESTGSITRETLQRRADFFQAKIAAQFDSLLGADGYLIWEKIVEPSDSPYNFDSERYGVGPGDPTEQVMRGAPGNPPPPPTVTATAPSSPANDNSPKVKGGAEAGSTVGVYKTMDCSGSPVATGSAADFASLGLAASVPADSTTTFTATATDEDGNTSDCSSSRLSLTGSTTYMEDSTAPETTIDWAPPGTTNDNTPTFGFSSSEAGSSFECMVDAGALGSCTSPHTTGPLADGPHTFEVRATDPAGNADPSAASRHFTVITRLPDADGDGVPDSSDACPTPPGPPSGCPPPLPSRPPPPVIAGPVGGRTAVGLNGRFTVPRQTVACPSAGPECIVTTSVSSVISIGARRRKNAVRLGGSSFIVRAGQVGAVGARLSRKGLRLLRRLKRIKAGVSITANRGDKVASKAVRVTLKAPKRTRRR